ncbi:hypothetical protein RFI_27165 [Reticulomyxa filosa]|uniref:SET domain-containing protein n=1 Tax=Reticulomyxa filosa TaxID=46433 RepID=X6M8G5_RETFI|nr:hypothetical protein RFI_27165 [Reticulomyxa filosa]|eukprot:ETO10209.1 hypothetical protein RFI_27165 [Reticulomyxa filosa]
MKKKKKKKKVVSIFAIATLRLAASLICVPITCSKGSAIRTIVPWVPNTRLSVKIVNFNVCNITISLPLNRFLFLSVFRPSYTCTCFVQTFLRGLGAYATKTFESNELVCEYVGEMITVEESEKRLQHMNEQRAPNFYFFQINSKLVADATNAGNEARFLNHSCDPNCETAIWYVNGEMRVGIFALRSIKLDEELTYDYKYVVKNPDIRTLAVDIFTYIRIHIISFAISIMKYTRVGLSSSSSTCFG